MKVSKETLDKLNAHQNAGKYHPLTCMSFKGCDRMKHNGGILVATESGWVCPCGKYTQEFGSEVESIEYVSKLEKASPLSFIRDGTISEEKLKALGFSLIGKDRIGKDTWRLTFPFEKFGERAYPFEIDFSWNPAYGNDNPNVGIVSIHFPEQEAVGVPNDLVDKEEWTDADEERAKNHKITLKSWTQPIAWKVTSMSRLVKIISSITGIYKW